MRLTDIAKTWLAEILKEGDAAIDATLGNGFDALFLAKHIGKTGHIFGFDVQKQAIISSRNLLKNEPCQQSLFHVGHEQMKEHIPCSYDRNIKAIMFNLGWLPNSDKSIITKPETTLSALSQSLELLAPNGRLSVMVYPGHQGGDDESKQVMHWLEQTCLNSQCLIYNAVVLPNRPTAPILLQVNKLNA